MTDNIHSEYKELIDYSREPANVKFADIRRHIATCDECKAQLDQIHSLKAAVLMNHQTTNDETECLAPEKIAAYINKQLDEKETTKIEELIQTNQQIKAAILHYALHSQSMREAGVLLAADSPNKTENSKPQVKIRFIDNIKHFFDWQIPAWLAVPITAVLLLAIGLQSPSPEKPEAMVAVYQDEPSIVFRETTLTPPGIGFFSAARTSKKVFSGINVNLLKNGKLEINWQAVPQANKYTVTLSKVLPVGFEEIVSESNFQPTVRFENLHLEKNKRYHWLISGDTKDNKIFQIEGGLVINN